MSVAAVILAGGGGSRFNGDDPGALPGAKLLAPMRGKPVVTWAIEAAAEAGLDELIVVSGAAGLAGIVPATATLLYNPDWESGVATSLQAALEWCSRQGHQAAVIGLGDNPGLRPQAWRDVATAPGGPLVFASYRGRRGHPVRLDAEIWPLLPVRGDEGARVVARGRPDLVTDVACEGMPIDIDTKEDLRRWS
ncbi:MAG: nucleotidyltransferase family protein [Acidimicrobiales bacterium]